VIYPSDASQPFGANIWQGNLSSVDGFSIAQGFLKASQVEDISN
jgi:hypothetical protein